MLVLLPLVAITVGGCIYYPMDFQNWVGEKEPIFYDVYLDLQLYSTSLGFTKSGPPFTLGFLAFGQKIHKSITVHSIVITSSDGHRYVLDDMAESTRVFEKKSYQYFSEAEAKKRGFRWSYSTAYFGEKVGKDSYKAASSVEIDIENREGRTLKLTADLTVVLNDGTSHRGIFEEIFASKRVKKWGWFALYHD